MINIKNKKTTIIITLFLISIACLICALSVNPNDYWWHIKAGEYIVTNKTIPFTDVFSWFGVQEGLYWYSHEWLTAVLLFIISPIKNSWFWFTLACSIGLLISLYLFNKKHYDNNIVLTLLWFGFGAWLLKGSLSPRPHMISFLLLATTLYLLFDLKSNENSKKIWLLPIVSILWSNFHGGSSNLPYVLTFIILITGLFEFKIGKIRGLKLTNLQKKKYLIVSLICIGVIAINPHGIDMITYPYINMNDTLMLNVIAEWRSPDLKISSDLILYIAMAIPVLLLFIREKEVDFTDFTLIGAFVYLSCKSVRFSILLFIVSTFIVCKYCNEVTFENVPFIDKFKKYKDIIQNSFLSLMIVVSVFAISIFTYGYFILDITEDFVAPIVSDEIIDVIKEENPKRLYNDYNYGGYLIYNEIPVFVDGRADMYSGHNLEDVFIIDYYAKQEVIDKYDFDMFLVSSESAISNYLSNNSDYEKLISDEKSVVYKEIN